METTSTRVRQMCSNMTSISFLMSVITKIYVICGLALLTVGIVGLVICTRYSLFVGPVYTMAFNLAVAAGVIIVFTAILGHFGAKARNFKVFVAYIASLLAVIIINSVIMGYMFSPFINVTRIFPKKDLCLSEKMAWDRMQSELQCCGENSARDWGPNVPLSCCLPFPAGATSLFECTTYSAHQMGCFSALWGTLSDLAFALAVTAAVVTCVQILILPVAGWIAYRLKYSQETPYKNLSDPLISAIDSNNSQYQSIPGQTICEPCVNNVS